MQNVGSSFVDGFMASAKTLLPCIDVERYRPSPRALATLIAVISVVAMAQIGPEVVLGAWAVAFVFAAGERIYTNIKTHAASKAFAARVVELVEQTSDKAEAMATVKRFFDQELPQLIKERDRVSIEPMIREGKLIFVVNS